MILKTFELKMTKAKAEQSGPDCLMCADFGRQRFGGALLERWGVGARDLYMGASLLAREGGGEPVKAFVEPLALDSRRLEDGPGSALHPRQPQRFRDLNNSGFRGSASEREGINLKALFDFHLGTKKSRPESGLYCRIVFQIARKRLVIRNGIRNRDSQARIRTVHRASVVSSA